MGIVSKGHGVIICLFVFLMLVETPCLGTDTKTAYTQDGINFISKARMDENIKYEYAKPGDYREVQVPLNTIVVGASEYVEDTSKQAVTRNTRMAETKNTRTYTTEQPSPVSKTSGTEKILLIGVILICGAVIYRGVSSIIKQYR
jgi:hypothetical protein